MIIIITRKLHEMGYIAKRALTLKVIFPGEDGAWWLEVEQDRQINKKQTG